MTREEKEVECDQKCGELLRSCALALYQPLHRLFTMSLTHHMIPVEWCGVFMLSPPSINQVTKLRFWITGQSHSSAQPQKFLSELYLLILLCPPLHLYNLDFKRTTPLCSNFCYFITTSPRAGPSLMWFFFTKAFDSVPHNQLLKLRTRGIGWSVALGASIPHRSNALC